MSQKVITGSPALSKRIRTRRKELGLTIEDAADRAGIGTKTWCRYEAGESIRTDKAKGLCKALKWTSLSDTEKSDDAFSVNEYRQHEAWSSYLEETLGIRAAMSFAVGSDQFYDKLKEDLEELAKMPRGTHIGQLSVSWLSMDLPKQFLMHYDYECLYKMKCRLIHLRRSAHDGLPMAAHNVLEELILYLCNEETKALPKLYPESEETWAADDDEDWVFNLFQDKNIVTWLYSDLYVDESNVYHISHWDKK
jgi:transcriptional regulator with XRE-family HTH domain